MFWIWTSHVQHGEPQLFIWYQVESYETHEEWLLMLSGFIHEYMQVVDLISGIPLLVLKPACSSTI